MQMRFFPNWTADDRDNFFFTVCVCVLLKPTKTKKLRNNYQEN